MPSEITRHWLPVASLLVAATLWGLFWYPLRLLDQAGLPGLWTTLVAYASASLPGLWVVWPLRHHIRREPWRLTALALSAGWCNVSFILALLDGTVVRVVLLFYLSPLWMVLIARVFLGERITAPAWLTLVAAMAGALLMLWDPGMGLPWPESRADWLAISSGLAFAVNNAYIRALRDVPVRVKTVVVWWGGIALAAVWLALQGASVPVVGAPVWLGAMMLGLVVVVAMTVTVQYGVTHMPLQRSAVILLFELVVAALSSLWLAQEMLMAREWIGGVFIIAAALLSARAASRSD